MLFLLLDENLRFVPRDRSAVEAYVDFLNSRLQRTIDVDQRVGIQGEIAAYLNVLDRLEEAYVLLHNALGTIKRESLGMRREIQQRIRLAHVLQHKKEFSSSTEMFEQIIQTCRSDENAKFYFDFAYQHAGKNFFDQEKYDLALWAFSMALELRKAKNSLCEQLDSTLAAIEKTQARIRLKS